MQKKKELSAAAIVTLVIVAIAGLGAIGLFGWQTWEFVDFLLPRDLLLMKILAVCNFDGFSYIWLAMSLFVGRWLQSLSKKLCTIAGVIDLILSLVCSVIQMMIADAERFLTAVDPNLIYFATAIIVVALVINIVTLLSLVHIEWPYISGEKQYIQHQPPALLPPVQQLPQSNIMSSQPSVSTPVQPVTQASVIDYDALAQAVIRHTGVLPAQQQQPQNPLQSPQLDTANQPGMNGTSNGHQKSQA